MDGSALGALITAVASIVVAIINRKSDPNGGSPSSGTPGSATAAAFHRPGAVSPGATRVWYVALAVLLLWMALSPAFVNHDFAGMNFIAIPIFFVPLALIVPVRPLKAAWMCLAMFAANFVLGPMSNRMAGSRFDTAFISDAPGDRNALQSLLLIAAATAAVSSIICYLRLKYRHSPSLSPSSSPFSPLIGSVTAELERLARLHEQGALSEAEFRRAKESVLEAAARRGQD